MPRVLESLTKEDQNQSPQVTPWRGACQELACVLPVTCTRGKGTIYWIQILLLLFSSCVTSGELPHLSDPQYCHP